MPRVIESKNAEVLRDLLIIEKMTKLPAVGARVMTSDEGDALASFLEVHPAVIIHDPDGCVAANHSFHLGHFTLPFLGIAKMSLKYCRLAMKG